MRVRKVLAIPCVAGFYFDDLEAIRRGARIDGAFYEGPPVTRGFKQIRQRGEAISIVLVLEDGEVAYGDCIAPQYSGIGGRDPLFLANDYVPVVLKEIAPRLINRELENFRNIADEIDRLEISGNRLHNALQYGATCAILDAVAKSKKKTMAEVIAEEYGTKVSTKPFLIDGQSGDDRYTNVDKMIMKKMDVLPHGLFNDLGLLGERGEKLLGYVKWVRDRISSKGERGYRPIIHIDTYGTLGILFKGDLEKTAEFIGKMEKAASPFEFWAEMPVDAGSTEAQVRANREIMRILRNSGAKVKLVVDEWCTTPEQIKRFADEEAADIVKVKMPEYGGIDKGIEAALRARQKLSVWISESCNSTNKSSECGVHVCLATHANVKTCTPGMGLDEGFATVYNEMQRVLAIIGV